MPGNSDGLVGWTSGDQLPSEVQAAGPGWRWLGSDTRLYVRSRSDACVLISAGVQAPDGDAGMTLRPLGDGGQGFEMIDEDGTLSAFVRVDAGTTVLEVDPDRAMSQLSASDTRLGTVYMSDVSIAAAPDDRCR